MIRRLLLTGLLMIPALAAIPHAEAAVSATCSQLLSLNLDPGVRPTPSAFSSHYVAKVIDRMNKGIEYARGDTPVVDMTPLLPSWVPQVSTAMSRLIDVQLRLIQQTDDLTKVSVCQHYDFVLLECGIDTVRDELTTALRQGKTLAIFRLSDLLQFLAEREKHLIRGARDPKYVDATWGTTRSFDPPATIWCCPEGDTANSCVQQQEQTCIEGEGSAFTTLDQCLGFGCQAPDPLPVEEGNMCPFTSDYFPPSLDTGYGCDERVMIGDRLNYLPMVDERDALTLVTTQVETYRQDTATLLGQTVPARPDHQTLFGCITQNGTCSMGPSVRCSSDGECAAQSMGVCEFQSDSSILKRTVRAAFSAKRDHLGILQDFLQMRRAEGGGREFSDELKTAPEFPAAKVQERLQRQREDYFQQGIRAGFRGVFREISRLQGEREASIYPIASDSQLQIADALSSLRQAVSSLSILSHTQNGARTFLVNFAYFLRRTCVSRPCSAKLDQILRIAFSDDCFPYATGAFLDDTADDPRWKRCALQACIGVPGGDALGFECNNVP